MSTPAAPPPPLPRVVHELAVRTPASLADVVSAWLFELGAAGLEEREEDEWTVLVVQADEPAVLEEIARGLTSHAAELSASEDLARAIEVSVRAVPGLDWQTEWMRHLGAVLIGDGLVLKPVWDTTPVPGGRQVIRFEPRMAFGDGSHPTTLLAAESVERFCRDKRGARVLDVGTGNGVLGLVALACGAASVRAIDIDPTCVAAAAANAELNGMADRLHVSSEPLREVNGRFDLVVANIDLLTLVELWPALASCLEAGGRLVVTGLLAGEDAPLRHAAGLMGFEVIQEERHRDYALLEFERLAR